MVFILSPYDKTLDLTKERNTNSCYEATKGLDFLVEILNHKEEFVINSECDRASS